MEHMRCPVIQPSQYPSTTDAPKLSFNAAKPSSTPTRQHPTSLFHLAMLNIQIGKIDEKATTYPGSKRRQEHCKSWLNNESNIALTASTRLQLSNNASVSARSREEVGGASNKVDLDGLDDQKSLKSLFKMHQQNETNMTRKSELEKYLLDASEDDNERFDILKWWKDNSSKYPIVSQVARDVLAIPVSTVASESAFSTRGRVIDPYRSSLAPNTVEALICTQQWIKKPSKINLREQIDELEQLDSVLESGGKAKA